MNDFDFLTGTWDVANRWRTDFLDAASPWEEFPAVSRATRHFDGAASFDEITFPTKGFAGLTLPQARAAPGQAERVLDQREGVRPAWLGIQDPGIREDLPGHR